MGVCMCIDVCFIYVRTDTRFAGIFAFTSAYAYVRMYAPVYLSEHMKKTNLRARE